MKAAPTHLVIRASAGTGKTFRLAMRFISLLAMGEPPRSLLATTFTRKAAGEMLDRVLKFLAEGSHGGARLEELREHAHADLTKEKCLEILQNLVRELGELRIGTIDALLHRVAGASGFAIGIAPGWRILTDAERDELMLRVLGEMLDEVPLSQREDLLRSLRQINGDTLNSSVHGPLLKVIGDASAMFRETGGAAEPWGRVRPESVPLSEAEFRRALEASERAIEHVPLKKDGTPYVKLQKAVEAAIECAEESRWESLVKSALMARLADEGPVYSKVAVPPIIVDLLMPLRRHALAVLLTRLAARNAAAHEIVKAFEARLWAAKLAASTVTFDDVPRLLLAAPFAGGLDHTFFALDAAVRHVMLDEFQDTSRVQFQLMRLLLDEVHQADDGRTMFFVGDSKQSLYSWRGGTPELLDRLGHADSPYPELPEMDLVVNFRSGKRIIDCVNDVFSTIAGNVALQEDGAAAAAGWGPRFQMHQAREGAPGGSVRIGMVRSEGPDETIREVMASATAERVAELHRQFPHATIAVLVRGKGMFAPLKYELTQRGIEASQEGVSALVDSPAAASVISLLHLVAHPADTAAAFLVAQSPLGAMLGYTDHTNGRATMRLVRKARRTIARRTLPRVLNKLARVLTPLTDERSSKRLFQLAQLASAEGAGADLDKFVRQARQHTLHDSADAPVRLMTIHAAKGLEFDIVVLPDLDTSWTEHGLKVLVQRPDAFSPPDLITLSPSAALRAAMPEMNELYVQNMQYKISEELSVLYVALTRPIHHLEIVLGSFDKPPTQLPTSSRGVLAAALGLSDALVWPENPANVAERPYSREVYAQGEPYVPVPARREVRASTQIGLTLAARREEALGARRRVSPSGLEGTSTLDLAEVLAPESEQLASATTRALEKGRALHALFEQVEWSDELPGEDALRRGLAGVGVEPERMAELLTEFARIMADPKVSKILKRPNGLWTVKREWAFLCPHTLDDGSEVLLDGRFDRVQIELDGEGVPLGADVIDFKTDAAAVGGGEGVDPHAERVRHYTPQLQAYARALGVLLKLPVGSIRAKLVFTSTCRVVEVALGTRN